MAEYDNIVNMCFQQSSIFKEMPSIAERLNQSEEIFNIKDDIITLFQNEIMYTNYSNITSAYQIGL